MNEKLISRLILCRIETFVRDLWPSGHLGQGGANIHTAAAAMIGACACCAGGSLPEAQERPWIAPPNTQASSAYFSRILA